jgi:hypothetical protein
MIGVVGCALLVARAVPAQTPFGGDDSGTIPSAKLTLTCENAIAKAWGKAAQCIQRCHVLRANGKLADATAVHVCKIIAGPNAGKSCLGKFTAAVVKAQAKDTTGACSCVNSSLFGGLAGPSPAGAVLGFLDANNGLVYCDATSGTPFGGAQGGYLPVAKSATQRCENRVAKGLGKAFACILKCHALRASGKLPDDTAEDACEANNAGKSCLEKFMSMGAALGSSCPSCLHVDSVASNVGLLGVLTESLIDKNNSLIYCSPTTTTTTTTTSTTTTSTSTTSTTLYGSPSRAFLAPLSSLID